MARHAASIVVRRPVEQVYPLFTHFNDFPKFMHFVHEVTYYDDQRSHWVVDIAGRHAWDATVVDGNLVSIRQPADIPAFNREMIALFERAKVSQLDLPPLDLDDSPQPEC